jgi:hypothetical protein
MQTAWKVVTQICGRKRGDIAQSCNSSTGQGVVIRSNVDIKVGSQTTEQYNQTILTCFASTLHIVGVHS